MSDTEFHPNGGMNKLELLRHEIIEDLVAMSADGDHEHSHLVADKHLLRLLRALGEESVANAFEMAADNCPFWYA